MPKRFIFIFHKESRSRQAFGMASLPSSGLKFKTKKKNVDDTVEKFK